MRVLSVDHGRRAGYAIMDDGKVTAIGSFMLTNKTGSNKSLFDFYEEVKSLIDQAKPDVVCCEYPADMLNAEVARQLIGYYTLVKLAAMQYGAKLCEIRPKTLKKTVAGNGNATKIEVCDALVKKLGVERSRIEIPIMYGTRIKKNAGKIKSYVYDESDALALAYYYFIEGYILT